MVSFRCLLIDIFFGFFFGTMGVVTAPLIGKTTKRAMAGWSLHGTYSGEVPLR